MKTPIVVLTAVTLLASSQPPLLAQTIQKHEQNEERRIEEGVSSGKLTPKESKRLQNEQDVIETERHMAAEDGKITKRERKDIRHDQKRLSADIKHKKHNTKRVKE